MQIMRAATGFLAAFGNTDVGRQDVAPDVNFVPHRRCQIPHYANRHAVTGYSMPLVAAPALKLTLREMTGFTGITGDCTRHEHHRPLATDRLQAGALASGLSVVRLVKGAARAAKVPMLVVAAVFESCSPTRTGDYWRNDFSGVADAVCDPAKIACARVPADWKPA